MRIYVANLRAYNDGELKGDWFDLPVELDEVFDRIFDESELDENGNPMHDWAIHDYEAPFRIHEHASIEKLNEIVEELQSADNYEKVVVNDSYSLVDLIEFANSIQQEQHVENFVPEVGLIEDLLSDLKEGSIFSVKKKLANVMASSVYIKSNSDELYYKIDGNGDYSTITGDDINETRKACIQSFVNEYK